MEISLCLSISAIIIACISLFWSIYLGYRDRGNIKATSNISYIEIDSYSEKPSKKFLYLKIKAVNCGRRPVILSMFGADYSDGLWGSLTFPARWYFNEGLFVLIKKKNF